MTSAFVPPEPWTGRSDPEDGEGAIRLHDLQTTEAGRALIGFACDAGVARNKGRVGAKEAPQAVRNAMRNLAADTASPAFCDLGTVTVEGDGLEAGQTLLAEQVAAALETKERVLVLGGGHETAFASYSGLKRKWPDQQIGIINLDAHLDLRAMGGAGGSSGTPFYQIRQLDPARFDYLCLGLAEEANTPALVARAQDWNVDMVFDRDLERDVTIGERKIHALFERSDLVYLTIDIDVLPHFVAPGVSAPAARGVPLPVIERLVDVVLQAARDGRAALPLADIVEVSPRFDQDHATARVAAYLARKLLLQ